MADIIDTAAEIEELQRNTALSAHRLNRSAVSAEHCAECGEDIPAPRRAAVPGCQTCAECQGVLELKISRGGCDAAFDFRHVLRLSHVLVRQAGRARGVQ